MAQVTQSKIPRVHLLIQSAGGFVGDGIAMYNFLNRLPVELVTYNGGAVESIAVLPYLAGKVRRASKTAVLTMHKTISGVSTKGEPATQLRAKADNADLHDSNVEQILRLYLKMPDSKWEVHAARDLLIPTEDALNFAMIHEVADFAPPQGTPHYNI
jgi:ATP-dependent Clp protease protease subunit